MSEEIYTVTIKRTDGDGLFEDTTIRSMPELTEALAWTLAAHEGEDRFILRQLAQLIAASGFEKAWVDSANHPESPSPKEFWDATVEFLKAWGISLE